MRRRRAMRACLVGAVGTAALIAASAAISAESASRIVDRTLVCRMSGVGFPDPVRVLEIYARPRLGGYSPTAGVYHSSDVHAYARTGPDGDQGTGALFLKGCAPSSVLHLPLSSRGLGGGPSALGSRQRCEVSARVLIRLRAVFDRPVVLRRERDYVIARGSIGAAYVAVATLPARKPLAFASANATGKARIFASSSVCREER
jgi:hypothetical protein